MLAGADAPQSGFWQMQVMGQFSSRIGGGTNEVHRTMIGERALGLPGRGRATTRTCRGGSTRRS